MNSSEDSNTLKKYKKDGNLNNLSFKYYDTLLQLAALKRTKNKTDKNVEKAMRKRKIVVLRNKERDVKTPESSLVRDITPGSLDKPPGRRLLPALKLDEPQLKQLPTSIFREKKNIISTEEKHLLTPRKLPQVKVINAKVKNEGGKVKNNLGSELLQAKDVNSLQKTINMRDLLTKKTFFDVSPNGKKDLISELKPVSRSFSKREAPYK